MLYLNIVCLVLSVTSICRGILNIEELTDMKYALDIVNKPLNSFELNPSEGLKVASRHGQEYYCKLPVVVVKDSDPSESVEEKILKSTPVSSLLEPMRQETCLKTVKGWWTYEFCFGKYIKQYHSEDDLPKGDITYLGFYESDFDWNRQTVDEPTPLKRHKLHRYHSQKYVNGTSCDVINYKRDTEMRFICDDSSMETYIARVDEPSTCTYVITVHTPYICAHPYTKPLRNPKPVEIVCRPVLSPEDYAAYEEEAQAQLNLKKEHEERLMKAKNFFQELSGNNGEDSPDVEESETGIFMENKIDSDIIGTNEETAKWINNILSMMTGVMSKERLDEILKKVEQKEAKTAATAAESKDAPQDALSKKEEDVHSQLLEDKESAEALAMIERFIIKERLIKMDSFKQKLLLLNVVDLMEKFKDQPSADRVRIVEKYITEYVDAIEKLADTKKQLNEFQSKLERSFIQDSIHLEEDNGKDAKDSSISVKLKVQKFESMEDLINNEMSEVKSRVEEAEMDPSWKKLEDDIGRGLEEAGFDAGDTSQIEIRVMTNRDNIGGSISLNDEEGERFKQMLLELVAGNSARKKEETKQKTLNDNYNLVWKRGVAKFQNLNENEEEKDELTEIKSPRL